MRSNSRFAPDARVRPRRRDAVCLGLIVASLTVILLSPRLGWACACGCSVFDVGTPSLLPDGPGGTVWFDYDFMNQYINWHHTQPASRGANDDKQIKTNFLTIGGQYMFNHDWGGMVTVPYTIRTFETASDSTPSENNQYNHANFGDVRAWAMYTGLMEDMSLGLLAGFKFNTGGFFLSAFRPRHLDRNRQHRPPGRSV